MPHIPQQFSKTLRHYLDARDDWIAARVLSTSRQGASAQRMADAAAELDKCVADIALAQIKARKP